MSSKEESREDHENQPVRISSFAKAVFEADEDAHAHPVLTSEQERTIRNVRRFESIRDRQAAQPAEPLVVTERRKSGPKGVTDRNVSDAADRIWQRGKGPVPTVKAIQAELGTGSTAKVGPLLLSWSIRNGLTPPPPPIPAALAKSINDYLDDVRNKTSKEWSDVLDASRQDTWTSLAALREAESEIEELTSNLAATQARRDEIHGAMLQQKAEILRIDEDLATTQERLFTVTARAERLEYERDSLLENLNEVKATLEDARRKAEALSIELVQAKIDGAKTKGELEGLMLKFADTDHVGTKSTPSGAGP